MGSPEPVALGFDVGGTKIQAVVIDALGRVLTRRRRPTPPGASARDVAELLLVEARLLGLTPSLGLGVAVAGQVRGDGFVYSAPNLGWRDIPFGELLREAFGRPVPLENDVRAATSAEWAFGAGRGRSDFVCLFLGTGVGGGVVSGGHLLRGQAGSAGELGHLTVRFDGRPCTCGNRGCLEAYAGGWAIARRARERFAEAANGEAPPEDARAVFALAKSGHSLAQEIVAEVVAALSAAIVSIANALNPERIVLGGGIVDGEPELLPRLRAAVAGRMLPPAALALELVASELGADAVAIGAALLARGGGSPPVGRSESSQGG